MTICDSLTDMFTCTCRGFNKCRRSFSEGPPQGAVAIGGRSDAATKFMEPTILTGVTWEDALMEEEIFGPILPVVNVSSVEEVRSSSWSMSLRPAGHQLYQQKRETLGALRVL